MIPPLVRYGHRIDLASGQEGVIAALGMDYAGVVIRERLAFETVWVPHGQYKLALKQFEPDDRVILPDGKEAVILEVNSPIKLRLAGIKERVVFAAPWEIYYQRGALPGV